MVTVIGKEQDCVLIGHRRKLMMDIDELLAISFGVATFNRYNVYFWVVIGKSSSAAVHVSIS